jgi:hypothetical protein
MALDNKKVAEELISYTIVTDRNSIINLLKKNGVKLSANPSNSEITIAVLVANSKSGSFKEELGKLLSSKVQEAGETFSNIVGNDQDFGFTGVDDVTYFPNVYSFTGMDDYQNVDGLFKKPTLGYKPMGLPTIATTTTGATTTGTTTTGATTTGTTTSSTSKTKVGSILASIGGFLKTNILTKENINAGVQVGLNKINNDTLQRANNLQLQAAMLEEQQNQINNRLKPSKGMSGNTILYIVIGVIALAGIGFVVYKQTKK